MNGIIENWLMNTGITYLAITGDGGEKVYPLHEVDAAERCLSDDDIAYQVAEISGLLSEFRKKWNEDDSIGSMAKERRRVALDMLKKSLDKEILDKERERLKKAEGELILEEYVKKEK